MKALIRKLSISLLICFALTNNLSAQTPEIIHTIQQGETLYRLSVTYDIPIQAICDANPGLSAENFRTGAVIRIPSVRPVASQPATIRRGTIQAAIILPFMLDNGAQKTESGARMIEYYEGFLIAVDSLKQQGISIDLHVYDTKEGTATINSILLKEELKQMDIIFGPLYPEQVPPLATFAEANNIRLVIPFTGKENSVLSVPTIYQVNTPQSYIYAEVYDCFTFHFPNANVILLETYDKEEKNDFINGLKQHLQAHSITVKNADVNASLDQLSAVLSTGKSNIFIPASGSEAVLLKLLPKLKQVAQKHPNTAIHLFGYPEWQTYTNHHLQSFYELDTYFYSPFYTNNLLPTTQAFLNAYRKWYQKELINTYPKYGMLGFDTAYFFLYGLSLYGAELEDNLHLMEITPVQNGFNFQRVSSESGFINRKVLFINYTKSHELRTINFN